MSTQSSPTRAAPNDAQSDRLLRAQIKLARTLRSTHYGHHVREYPAEAPPTGIEFAKHVGNNTPLVVREFASLWPALSSSQDSGVEGKWTNEFLTRVMGETEVSVAITGDGRADAVVSVEDGRARQDVKSSVKEQIVQVNGTSRCYKDGDRHVFATPHTAQLPFSTALSYILSTQQRLPVPNTSSHVTCAKYGTRQTTSTERPLSNTPHQPIIYLQAQNDCLRSEYPHLINHLPMTDLHPAWITDVLGESPEAINLWIGTKHSVSTMHSDPYENIYVVIRGSKTFVIAPPGEAWFYSKSWFSTAEWMESQEPSQNDESGDKTATNEHGAGEVNKVPHVTLQATEDASKIPWYAIPHPLHVSKALLEKYPRLRHRPQPYTVTVHAGDMLYLPRGWLHHVEQQEDEDGLCVAVNSWFEGWDGGMGRDWGYGRFVDSIDCIVSGREDEEEMSDDEDQAGYQ